MFARAIVLAIFISSLAAIPRHLYAKDAIATPPARLRQILNDDEPTKKLRQFTESVEKKNVGKAISHLNHPDTNLIQFLNAEVQGAPVLIYAIRNRLKPLTNQLISKGANLNAREKKTGLTPLIQAVIRKDTPLVKDLLIHGADIKMKANNRKSALDYARDNGSPPEMIELLN